MGDARTVKVRIAVAADEDGSINGYFIHECRPEAAALRWAMHGMKRPCASIIEADVPLADAPTIQATVTKAEEGE